MSPSLSNEPTTKETALLLLLFLHSPLTATMNCFLLLLLQKPHPAPSNERTEKEDKEQIIEMAN